MTAVVRQTGLAVASETACAQGPASIVEEIARAAGADIVGFGDVREALTPEFRHLPNGISLGIVHPAVRLLKDPRAAVTEAGLLRALSDHRDARGQCVLETALRRIAEVLRAQGYRYFCCPPEVDPMETPFAALMVRRFSHKAAATCAGLGTVGRHGLLIHPEFGPHVVWATIVTNAPLPTSRPEVESHCGACGLCVEACPAGAISGRSWRREDGMIRMVDVDRCRAVLDDNERTTGRRVCGRCAAACTSARLSLGSF